MENGSLIILAFTYDGKIIIREKPDGTKDVFSICVPTLEDMRKPKEAARKKACIEIIYFEFPLLRPCLAEEVYVQPKQESIVDIGEYRADNETIHNVRLSEISSHKGETTFIMQMISRRWEGEASIFFSIGEKVVCR